MSKRLCIIIGVVLALCLTGCMVTTRLDLPAWKMFRKEMLARDCITCLEARQGPAALLVECYYKNISEDELEDLKAELKTFLSSEKFLGEYVAYAREMAEKDTSIGLMRPMSNIQIDLYPAGTDRSVWMSIAMYYAETYRSDRWMEIDNYQTWNELMS